MYVGRVKGNKFVWDLVKKMVFNQEGEIDHFITIDNEYIKAQKDKTFTVDKLGEYYQFKLEMIEEIRKTKEGQ